VKVSWDDDIPKIWKNNPNVPNHQADMHDDFSPECWIHQEEVGLNERFGD